MIVKNIITYKGYASCRCIICPGKYQFRSLFHYWIWYLKKTLVEKKTVEVFQKQTVIYD